ncbi:MAG: outer membrane beta-barrel protein [Planctomycetota bacterium]
MRKGIISICLAIGFVFPVAAAGQLVLPAVTPANQNSVQTTPAPPVVNPSYPWRDTAPPISLQTQANRTPETQYVPTPPGMQRNTLFASARQEEQVAPPQAAVQSPPAPVSDASNYSFEPVQTAPGTDYFQAPESVIEPGLSVADKAVAAPDYCYNNCCQTGLPCRQGCVKRLFGTSPGGLTVGGWAQIGFHNRDNIMFNNLRNEWNAQQIWLYAEKSTCYDSMNWSRGFRIDGLYGLDAQDVQAIGNPPTGNPDGWDNDWDNGSFGFALPQAYLQASNAMWDVKLGKFFSPFGFERVGAPNNFFYSHTYTRYFNEPFTMSGILAERRVSGDQSYIIGATAGWETAFENNDGGNVVLGTRRSVGPFIDLALTTSAGDTGYRGTGIFSSAVAKMQLTGCTQYVLQFNNYNIEDDNAFALVQYLFRDITPCLGVGARLEWWKSDQIFGGPTSSTYDFTIGANYRPTPNLMFRPELRWDWGAAAVDNGQTIIGFDTVILF